MVDPAPGPRGTTLVIGYGNTLRGDDGVGPRVAAVVAGWALPGVEALAVHQLGPELAGLLAAARRAVFVDARPAEAGESYQVRPVAPADSSPTLAHTSDPRALLALARAAFRTSPAAWLITVPATDLNLGEELSPTAARGMSAALGHLARFLQAIRVRDEDTDRSREVVSTQAEWATSDALERDAVPTPPAPTD